MLPLALQQQLAGEEQQDLLAASTAFFKWRQAALKANFRRELEGILEEVAQEEEASVRVQKQLQRTQERLDETTQALSKLSSEQRLALAHTDQLQSQNDELFKALEAAEGASRVHAEQARAAGIMHQEEARRRQEEGRRSGMELEAVREQQQQTLAQQQALLEALAQRDREVAEASQDGLHHKRNSARLQEEVERLEAIARATGERAAAAEAQAAARSDTVAKLYAELSGLRERYHAELSELKAARVGAADVQRMRERMDSMQGVNDSLVAARDELRASMEGTMAKLAATEQRLKRQAVAATLRDAIIDEIADIGRGGDDSHIYQATARIASELDLALANNADLAERLTAADAVIAQQQGHIRRMAEECGTLEVQLRESREHRDAQHRISAELAAELKRLAAASALGPILVLDRDGNLVPQEAPLQPPPSATAPATSQLEAQSTAVRVILADKAFGLGALCQAIAAHPGAVQSVRSQLGECRALAEALRVDVEEVGALLAVRPFEGEELVRKLPLLQDRLSKTETCLVAAREDLSLKQVHAVSLEARVLAAESALRSASSLLQGWSGLLAEVAAAEDGRLEPDIRLGLREELKSREDALHRAMLDLAATAPPLLSGDPGYAGAQVAMREAGNAMMDLALTLGDRIVDAPATRTRVLNAEHLLLDRAATLTRFREVLAAAPGEVADMNERLTAVIPDVQCIAPAVEEMLRCVQHYLAAGQAEIVDVVALQGEVLTLRGLVRTKDMTIKALEAVGGGFRTGSPSKRAVKMVPLEALHAAERSRDIVAGEKAALQARLVEQRVRLVAARHRIVNYMASLRRTCELAEVFYKWRTTAAVLKAERSFADMVAAQEEQARVEQQARVDKARMEAEAEAMRTSHAAQISALNESHTAEVAALTSSHAAEVAALTARHTAEVAAMQTAHAEERRKTKAAALEAATMRVTVMRRITKMQTARWRECLTYYVLYFWRARVQRQRAARQRWRAFSERLRLLEEPENPTYRDLLYGPRMTIARRIMLRMRDASDLRTTWAMTGAQVARMVLQAWRGWAYIKRQAMKVDALTEAVPLFIENLGDRRRLERAWLGLRLWAAGSATRRAHDAIQDYEAATAEADAAAAEAEAACAAADLAVAEAQAQTQQAQEALAASEAAQLLPLPPPPGYELAGLPGLMAPGQAPLGGEAWYQPLPYQPPPPPDREAATQYMPNVHTILTAGARAPEHTAAEEAVAAAAAAGFDMYMQPVSAAPQHPSDAGGGLGPSESMGGYLPQTSSWGPPGTWVDAPMPGPASEAAAEANALARRRASAPGAVARSAARANEPYGRAAASAGGALGGGGGAGRPASNGRPSSTGRGPLQQVSDNQGGRASRRGGTTGGGAGGKAGGQASAGGRGGGGGGGYNRTSAAGVARPAVATLAERAERLVRAVDSIAAGVADTAALLSPRTQVLQMALEGATERPGDPDDGPAGEQEQERAGSRPVSPTRRIQADGSTVVEYQRRPSDSGGPSASPPRSPHDHRSSTWAPGSSGGRGGSSPGRPAQQQPAPLPSRPPERDPRPSAGGPGGQPRNSVQVLLNRLPGRNRPLREDARPLARAVVPASSAAAEAPARGAYGHVASRLHEETVSTTAKKKLPGRPPERGAANLTSLPAPPLTSMGAPLPTFLPPNTNTPGPVTAMQLDAAMYGRPAGPPHAPPAPAPLPIHTAWPHVPASTLPGMGAAGAGPNTAEVLRRRGEQWPEAPAPYVPTLAYSGPAAADPRASASAQQHGSAAGYSRPMHSSDPAAPAPGQAAPAGTRVGRVVRFERITASPSPGAGPSGQGDDGGDGGADAATAAPGGFSSTTYITLPSPVKVSIRLPGS